MAQHIFTGSGAPTTVPSRVGQHYIDLTNKITYVSAGTSSASDWRISDAAAAVSAHVLQPDPHPQYETSAEAQAKVDAHANLTNNPHAVTKAQVGLGNVDNTSDVNKPISTATQTALNLKYDASNPSGYQTAAQVSSSVSGAITTHEAASDPHPQYLTSAEGNAAYQPLDGDLTAVAALATTGIVSRTAANTFNTRTITAGAGISLTNGDGVLGNPTITNTDLGSTAVSTHVGLSDPHTQYALDADLSAGLALKANLAGGNTFTGVQNFTSPTGEIMIVGNSASADSYYQTFNQRGYVGFSGSDQYMIFQGTTGKAIALCVNSTTFGAGKAVIINPVGSVGIGGVSPVSSALLELSSTTQGFLMPRMTSAERDAIATPAQGLQVYDTTLKTICTFDGSVWIFQIAQVVQNNQGTNSSTYGNVTELVTPTLPTGRYVIEFAGAFQSTSTLAGIGIRLNGSTISAINAKWNISQAANGTDSDFQYSQLTNTTDVTSTSALTANADFPVTGFGVFSLSSPGTVAIQIRSELALTSISIRINSALIIRRITG